MEGRWHKDQTTIQQILEDASHSLTWLKQQYNQSINQSINQSKIIDQEISRKKAPAQWTGAFSELKKLSIYLIRS